MELSMVSMWGNKTGFYSGSEKERKWVVQKERSRENTMEQLMEIS